jgi:hypothetical protein
MKDSPVEAQFISLLAWFVNSVDDILRVFFDSLARGLVSLVHLTWDGAE